MLNDNLYSVIYLIIGQNVFKWIYIIFILKYMKIMILVYVPNFKASSCKRTKKNLFLSTLKIYSNE